MCMPHASSTYSSGSYVKEKIKKHIKPLSKNELQKGDPDFIDERKTPYEPKEKEKSFLESLFE